MYAGTGSVAGAAHSFEYTVEAPLISHVVGFSTSIDLPKNDCRTIWQMNVCDKHTLECAKTNRPLRNQGSLFSSVASFLGSESEPLFAPHPFRVVCDDTRNKAHRA